MATMGFASVCSRRNDASARAMGLRDTSLSTTAGYGIFETVEARVDIRSSLKPSTASEKTLT